MNRLTLLTERLNIRYVSAADLEAIHELNSLPETARYNTLGIPGSIEETQELLGGWLASLQEQPITRFTFVIEDAGATAIGMIAINKGKPKYNNAEVWFKLHKDHWAKGYATEALKKILEFGFNDLGLHRIEAGCAVENIGSIKVLEKAGFIKEGRKRQHLPLKTAWSDCFEYGILRSEWI